MEAEITWTRTLVSWRRVEGVRAEWVRVRFLSRVGVVWVYSQAFIVVGILLFIFMEYKREVVRLEWLMVWIKGGSHVLFNFMAWMTSSVTYSLRSTLPLKPSHRNPRKLENFLSSITSLFTYTPRTACLVL